VPPPATALYRSWSVSSQLPVAARCPPGSTFEGRVSFGAAHNFLFYQVNAKLQENANLTSKNKQID